MAVLLSLRAIIPAPVAALSILYELQRPIENRADRLIVRDSMCLPQDECGQAVIVHVPMWVGDIQ